MTNKNDTNISDNAEYICPATDCNLSDEEKIQACKAILEAPGDRAWVIYFAKSNGWWRDEVADPCKAILESDGNKTCTIHLAKRDGWWKDPK